MKKSVALLGMATAMMAAAATTYRQIDNHPDFGDTFRFNYQGGSSRQSKYKRDRMNPLKEERITRAKRKASRKSRKNNRRK